MLPKQSNMSRIVQNFGFVARPFTLFFAVLMLHACLACTLSLYSIQTRALINAAATRCWGADHVHKSGKSDAHLRVSVKHLRVVAR